MKFIGTNMDCCELFLRLKSSYKYTKQLQEIRNWNSEIIFV